LAADGKFLPTKVLFPEKDLFVVKKQGRGLIYVKKSRFAVQKNIYIFARMYIYVYICGDLFE
jgi:hypothetical protein